MLAAVFACNNNSQTTTTARITKTVNPKWKGKWERTAWQSGADLAIDSVTADSIYFNLGAVDGGHTGELEGSAIIKDSVATFHSSDEYDTCRITFTLRGDSIIAVDQQMGQCGAAMGVDYSGNFYSEKYPHKPKQDEDSVSETMTSLKILNATADSSLKTLTGKDYNLFVNSTQLTSDDDDLDSLNVKVHASGVRGLFTEMENIVMIDSSNNIWAAVLDDQKVIYYTNTKKFQDKLPKTIENWRSRFADYPIEYKNANQ